MARAKQTPPARVVPITPIEARRRNVLRVSQAEAAKAAGISRQYWALIERGYPARPELQERVAAVLACPAEELFGPAVEAAA